MKQNKNSVFRRVVSGALSAACVLSGTALAGASVINQATTEVSALSAGADVPFSWDNATVYFLLTDRFYNGNTSNDHSYGRGQKNGQNVNYDTTGAFKGGDFAGITKKINEGYFDDLGVNAIWLSAPYEQIHGYCVAGDGDSFAHYSYHGYYVLDYTESDKNFGTKEEFKTMVDTAHEHGIRIVMDIVMNHSGYNTIQDMYEYDFGELKSGWQDYYYNHQNVNNSSYHSYINYDASASIWGKWWGADWIRCGLPGYTQGSGEIEGSLAGLPDFKTGATNQVGLPNLLKTKWSKEGTLAAKTAKYGSSDTVTGYISTWLAEWVREYGVDGFRCDTAKHVELSAWKQLKTKCVAALKEWKQANPSKKMDDLDFWMTGECFGHQMAKSNYFTDGGFDSMINFEFAPAVNSSNIPGAGSVESTYSRYAGSINSDPSFNVLSYLASHDTTLIKGDRKYAGSFLLMLPGAIQIYYGDETNRPLDSSAKANADPDAGHQLRTFMNWDNLDQGVLSHWQKLGQFRNNHIAVGAGQHKVISAYDSSNGYTFSRTYNKNGIEDKVVVTLFASANKQVTIDVSSVWSDGLEVTNFYDGTSAKVSGGKVTFNSGANGTILLQEPQGKKGKVNVTHINKDTGATIKTETMQGLLGESYTVKPLSTEGYKLASTSGSTSGVYSETEANVTFYYTFDSGNYAYVVTKHVDADSGAEIAESSTQTKKIGSSYATEAADIKNYELSTTPSNATGTVVKGTTTVIYKYKYVEPTNLIVHYKNSNNWSSVCLYAYDESGSTVKEFTGKWPGKAMTAESNGWYVCEVPDTEAATIIFNNNNGGAQEPSGVGTPGYDASGEVWVSGGKLCASGKVNVRYVSTDGTLLGSEVLKGVADGSTTYTTSAKTFSGYTLQSTPTNASGTFTESTITVTYTYIAHAEPIPTDLVNNSKISATSVPKCTWVTLTGAASGGSGDYKYAFYYKKSTSAAWTSVGEIYGNQSTVSFGPASVATYLVKVNVKDSSGTVARKEFTLKSTSPSSTSLQNKSTVGSTSIVKGTPIKITGKASGGSGSYKYAFYYKKTTSKAFTAISTEYGSATTATFTPASAADYNVRINVKDGNGTIVTMQYKLTAGGTSTALTNNSTVSPTSTTVGNTVTLKGAASGGSGSYKYAFYYKKSTSSSYTVLGTAYGTATTASFKPGSAATYDVMINVKDSSNNVVSKSFTVKATAAPATALTNNSTISATSVSKGTAVKLTAKAAGGTSPYYYAFYYKKSTSSNWTTIGTEFGTATTATFTPAAAATYNVMVKIMDKTGETVSKTFNVTSK